MAEALRILLVGRPNVGKSTLFNRVLGRRKAVVSPTRGTTRDRIEGTTVWQGRPMRFFDMAGFEVKSATELEEAVQRNLRRGLQEADIFVFVCDGQDGIVPLDSMIMDELRLVGKPVIVAVNKMDDKNVVPADAFGFGLADVMAISALHGKGVGDLMDRVLQRGTGQESGPAKFAGAEQPPAIAIVGRQNVGKSTLFNALLREERVVVSDVAGTTRDAVDTLLDFKGKPVILIDTAGLRHRRKVHNTVDVYSMARSMESIGRCDTALLVIDGSMGVTTDDQRIASSIADAGRGIVIVVNKWDLVEGADPGRLPEQVHRQLPFVSHAPVIAISAKTGLNISKALSEALMVSGRLHRGLDGAALNRLLQQAWQSHPPSRYRGRPVHLKKAEWQSGPPAVITLTTAPIGRLTAPYLHYLQKRLHAYPGLVGVPLQLAVKEPDLLPGRRRTAAERKKRRIHTPWGGTMEWEDTKRS